MPSRTDSVSRTIREPAGHALPVPFDQTRGQQVLQGVAPLPDVLGGGFLARDRLGQQHAVHGSERGMVLFEGYGRGEVGRPVLTEPPVGQMLAVELLTEVEIPSNSRFLLGK